ncbi:MAG: hypothetical protein GYA17_01515 [Chloroflexi bacterium]|nr:hypothetical protein [Anaerolineaceae bacterium]NMB87004.1 hypothetical protein [Chloroflexota bacterium]
MKTIAIRSLPELSGSGGDLWRAWEVTIDQVTYRVQETRIGFQVLTADEYQRVIPAQPTVKAEVLAALQAWQQKQ